MATLSLPDFPEKSEPDVDDISGFMNVANLGQWALPGSLASRTGTKSPLSLARLDVK